MSDTTKVEGWVEYHGRYSADNLLCTVKQLKRVQVQDQEKKKGK